MLCCAAGVVLAGPPAALAAGKSSEFAEGIHILEQLEVSSHADNLPWVYTETDGTEILSLCSDAATRSLITILRSRNALINDTLPAYLRGNLASPRIMVLYEADDTEELRRGLLRRQYVLTETGAELSRRRPPEGVPQTMWMQDRDVAVFSANLRYGPPHDATLSQRWPYSATTAMRFVLERQYPQPPAWLIEGLEIHLRDATLIDDTFVLPALPWVSPRATAALRKNPREAAGLFPLEELFASDAASHPRGTGDIFSTWEVEAALFVRWGLESDRRAQREAFWRFVNRAASEPVTEELFVEHFGRTFRSVEHDLSSYLGTAVQTEITVNLPRRWKHGKPALRLATEEQVGRVKGEWERMQARSFAPVDPGARLEALERARRTTRRAFELGTSDPWLLGLRGLIEVDAGEHETARMFLEEAVRGDIDRPGAFLELARMRLLAAETNPGSRYGTISTGQLMSVLEPLAAARTQQPLMADVYMLMADACAQSGALMDPQYLRMLAEGVRLFPRNVDLVCRVAEVHAGSGLRVIAHEMIEQSLTLAHGAVARERLESLQTSLSGGVQFRLRTTSTAP